MRLAHHAGAVRQCPQLLLQLAARPLPVHGRRPLLARPDEAVQPGYRAANAVNLLPQLWHLYLQLLHALSQGVARLRRGLHRERLPSQLLRLLRVGVPLPLVLSLGYNLRHNAAVAAHPRLHSAEDCLLQLLVALVPYQRRHAADQR